MESVWEVGKEIWTVDGAEKLCWRRDTIKREGTQLENTTRKARSNRQETSFCIQKKKNKKSE